MSTRIVVAIGLVASGCGDVVNHLADAPPLDDSKSIDGSTIDAPPPRCDPANPFGTPVAVAVLNSGADETGVSLTADELTAVFSSSRAGGVGLSDIYISQRATRTAAWGAPSLLAGVNTAGFELRPSFTGDGLTLYIEYRANANATLDIVRSTRATTGAAFGAPSLVTGINGTVDDAQPFVMPDHSAIYFMSTRSVNGDNDLYVATGSAGSFGSPTPVTGTNIASASSEGYPTVTPDGLALYFRSDRAGNSNFDVWLASRTSVATGFNAPVNVSILNTGVAEAPNWISADNCVLYMTRNIGTVASNNDIFVATKP